MEFLFWRKFRFLLHSHHKTFLEKKELKKKSERTTITVRTLSGYPFIFKCGSLTSHLNVKVETLQTSQQVLLALLCCVGHKRNGERRLTQPACKSLSEPWYSLSIRLTGNPRGGEKFLTDEVTKSSKMWQIRPEQQQMDVLVSRHIGEKLSTMGYAENLRLLLLRLLPLSNLLCCHDSLAMSFL